MADGLGEYPQARARDTLAGDGRPMKQGRSTQAAQPRGQSFSRYVALLRGINVGGKNKLPMATLNRIFCDCGCASVQTYIQSGNVIFSANAPLAKQLAPLTTAAIADTFGYQIPVILRSADEMHHAARRNPFLKSDSDVNLLYVGFLAEAPTTKQLAALDPNRSPGDSFAVVGREIYMHLATGAAKTKLTNAYFDKTLGTVSTFRNWRTVLKLCELSR
jgi:uncharacterized protein (DUF1697 family)